LQLDSQGNETAASFTVNFNPAILSISSVSSPAVNPDVALGTGVPAGTTLTVNGTQAASGRIGILIDSSNSFAFGTRQIIRLTFRAAANAPNGLTPVTFGSTPIPQSVSDAGGNLLPTIYEGGFVSFGPTAAGVEVSGRVLTPDGRGLRNATVIAIDALGNRRTATTSSFGYYRFDDTEAGGTYLIAVSSKRFRFASRIVTITDNLSDINITGQD